MLTLIFGWLILIGVILYQRNERNIKYSKICPKCGHVINPQLTGIRYHYRYECPRCGYNPYSC